MTLRPILILAATLAACAASAHQGEAAGGGFVTGVLHPVTGWDHVAAMVAVGLWGAFQGAPAIWALPVAFPLVMAVGGALAVAGLPFLAVELGIAVSGLVVGLLVALALRPPLPGAAAVHDAFGDMGPFYASLLHPLADPAQGVALAGAAAMLARQRLETVRPAFAALAICGALAAGAATAGLAPNVPQQALAVLAVTLGLAALAGAAAPRPAVLALAGATGVAAGLALSAVGGGRDAALAMIGGAAGVAGFALFLWGGVDLAVRRLGPVAGMVAGSWVAAVGLMTAALGA